MRIPSGTVDQYLYFYAVDATNFTTPETGLATWTVYRSRDGAAAAIFTTPTINETSAANMPGVYELLLDEDTTIAAGNDSEEMVLFITHAGMAPVVRTIELYRPKITLGETLTTSSGLISNTTAIASVSGAVGSVTGAVGSVTGNVGGNVTGSVGSVTGLTAAHLDVAVSSRLATAGYTAPDNASISAILVDTAEIGVAGAGLTALASAANLATVDTVVDAILVDTGTDIPATLATISGYLDTEIAAILADTNELQTDWANGGRLDLILDARASQASVDTIDGIVDAILADTGTDGVVVAAGSKTGYSLTATTGLGNQTADITGTITTATNLTNLPGIPANWITAAGIATGAIDADALAADAVTEIWAGSTSPSAATIADSVWDEVLSGHLTAGSTGNALNAAGAAGDPWSTALPGAYGAGTAGKIIGDNINAPLSTIDTVVDAILVDTGTTLPAQITALNDLTGAEVANAVWDEVLTGYATLASSAVYLKNAHAHAETVDTDWADGGRLDLILDARASQTSVNDIPTNAELSTALGTADDATLAQIALVKAKTDLIPAAPAAVGDIPTATQNADALLNRDMSAVSDTTARSPLNALRLLRNKYSIAAGVMTITKENDTTEAWTTTLTTDPTAEPITASDPA
jgi:hypothetical protein